MEDLGDDPLVWLLPVLPGLTNPFEGLLLLAGLAVPVPPPPGLELKLLPPPLFGKVVGRL